MNYLTPHNEDWSTGWEHKPFATPNRENPLNKCVQHQAECCIVASVLFLQVVTQRYSDIQNICHHAFSGQHLN